MKTQPKLFGLFGDPVAHSLSPDFQNEAFKLLGINGLYLKFRIKKEELPHALQALRCLDFGGVNITIPHKQRVIPYLDRLEGDAALTGSVNTILHQEGKLIGYSTDGEGFLLSLRKEAGFEPKNKKVIILGVGGAARAIAFSLIKEGIANLYLVGRNQIKQEDLLAAIKEKTGFKAKGIAFADVLLGDLASAADLVVNATPVGMAPEIDAIPSFPLNYCSAQCLIYDLIYNPLETRFLREARYLGLSALGGLGMLIYQGILACRIWTGLTPPVEPLRRVLEGILQGESAL